MKTFKKISRNFGMKTMFLTVTLMTLSCSNNEENINENQESASNFYITDAPTDNSNVSGVIVTITDLRVNGISVENFTKTTIDLMQYQNGTKKLLGDLKLMAGSYSNIELVLDNKFDASGNAPGTYVKLSDGTKDELSSTAMSTISLAKSFEILPVSSDIVLDFDIRKAIVSNSGNFEFVTTGELENSIRVINDDMSGEISGTLTDAQNTSEMIIVYAYEKGSFDADVETNGQGESNVMFSNAVTSSVVSDFTANYELNFLKEGEYELHFVSYKDEDNDGEFEFNAMLEVETNSNINFKSINVTSNTSVNLIGSVKGTF